MSFWAKLFKRKTKEESETRIENYTKEDTLESELYYEKISGTLDLGWYWSENKEEFQRAKIAEEDRATHFYVIGATGTGKTKFLEFLIQQDIENKNGFGVIDPHGDLIEDIKGFLILHYTPTDADISDRVVLIDPTDPNFTVTFNPLEKISNVSIAEQANELVGSFKKIWSDSWGVRMEDLMRNSLISLGEAELALTALPQFLSNRAFRGGVLEKVSHPIAQNYFQRFDTITDRSQVTWIEPVMNKINAFFADERIRQMFSSNKSSFNLREIMDQKKMLLIKLDKGKLKDSADLLGSLLMAKIQMAAFSRSDIPQNKRVPFYLYIDEFQNFANESFSVVLSEARKYRLSLIMAHQTLAQIPTELRSLILGNTGIQVYFRINRQDAQLLAKEAFEYSGYEVKTMSSFRPNFWSLGEEWEHHIEELQNLSPRVCYVKHKIEGGVIPIQTVEIEWAREVLEMGEDKYQEFLKNLPFGRKYLVARKALVELEDKMQKLIKEEIEKKQARQEEMRIPVQSRQKYAEREEVEKIAPLEKLRKKTDLEDISSEEKFLLEFISQNPDMFVTKIYKALQLSGYKGDRLKGSLIERGLIIQEETRKGSKGRLAKILVITDKGNSILNKIVLAGKGGDLHKHLQMMLKEQAQVLGWIAKIEERIPRTLETVDVGLRKEDIRIAIEISSTSKVDYEIQNIRKCFEAGYDYVLSVCEEEKTINLIKKEARKNFTHKEREKLRFYHPAQVKDFLINISSQSIVSEKGIVSDNILKKKLLLDTKEAADYLGIKKSTLYEWVIQRKIPYTKVGRLLKFRIEDLDSWLRKRTKEEEDHYIE